MTVCAYMCYGYVIEYNNVLQQMMSQSVEIDMWDTIC